MFVLPGMVLVRAFDIPNVPQRWLAMFLGSVTFNHLLVTLIALLHLDPLTSYRVVTAALIAAQLFMMARRVAAPGTSAQPGTSILSAIGREVDGRQPRRARRHLLQHLETWRSQRLREQRPRELEHLGADLVGRIVSVRSMGYPQFIPTTWAVTYIFTGQRNSILLLYLYRSHHRPHRPARGHAGPAELVLCGVPALVFVWFVAEIREPWIRSTLQEGFPDWIAAIFALGGTALFLTNAPEAVSIDERSPPRCCRCVFSPSPRRRNRCTACLRSRS